MRKITSKKDEARKQKRNNTILGIFLVIVMLFSVVGYGFLGRPDGSEENSSNVNYNGYVFIPQGAAWTLDLQGLTFIFKNNPNEVDDIFSLVNPINNYQQKPLYLYSENSGAELEIYTNLNQIALRMQKACPEYVNCTDEDLPTKTCEDNFIIIKEGNYSNIIQDENCVFIEGKQEDLVQIVDEFLFKILGIK